MPTALTATEDCNCFVVRSDARHVTQRYEQFLAPIGLRATACSRSDGVISTFGVM